ncbi:hypothetical protein VaNZ11_015317 [Volvox africanus]|uniref:Uncharacterized protein n=1 Tax=Volvox africanus TaxID=51714 RepID=A0ABQ5SKD8_9CHLO|nr:hypothetical protein VaNZ11_015317 [Volvox africanus]
MEIGSAFGRTDLGGETFNVFDGFLENEGVWDSALGDEDKLLSCIVRGIDQHTARLSAPGSTESHDIDIDTVDWNAIYSAHGLDSPIMSPRYSLQLSGTPNGTTTTPPTFRLPWQQTRQATATATIPPAPGARFSLSGATHTQDRALPVLAAACNGSGLGSASSASGNGESPLCEPPGCPPSAPSTAAWQSSPTWHPSLALATHHTASWFLANNSVAPRADAITSTIATPTAAVAAIAPDDAGRSSSDENDSGGCGGSPGAARPASMPAPTIRPAPIRIPVDVASLAHAMAAAPAAPLSTFPTSGTCSSATASIAMAATPPAVDDGMGVCHSSCADTAATVPITGPLPLLPSHDGGSIAVSAPAVCVISPPPPPPPQPPTATAVAAGTAASPGKACDIQPGELVPVLSQSSACGAAADFSDGNSRTAAVVEDQSSPRPAAPPPRSPAGGPYGSTPVPPNFAPQPPPLPESLPSPPPGTHARQLARAAAAIAAAAMLRQPPPDLEAMGLLPPGFPQSRLPVLQFPKATMPYQQQQYSGAARSCISNACCDGGCGRNTSAANASWNPVCSGCAYRSGSGGCWYTEGPNRGWQQLAQRHHPYRRVQCGNGYYAGSNVHTPATSPYQRPQCAVPGTATGYYHSCPTAAAPSSQPQHRNLGLAAPWYLSHGDEAAALAPAQPAQELSPSCASSGGGHDCSGGVRQQHGGPLQGSGGVQAQRLTYGAVRVVKDASSRAVDGSGAVLRDDRPAAEVAGMNVDARTSSNGGSCIPDDMPRLDLTAEVDDNEAGMQLLQELLHAPSSNGVPSKSIAGSAMAPPPPHTIWYSSPWRDRPVVLTPAQSYAAPCSDNTRGVAVLQTPPPPPPYPSPCPSLNGRRDIQTVQAPSTCSLPYGRGQARSQQLEWHFGSRPNSTTAPPLACSPPPDPSNSRCFCPECRRKYASGSACTQGPRPSGAATSSPALPPPPPPVPTYPPQLPPCPSTPYMSAPSSFSRITLHGSGSTTRCTLPCCNPSLAAAAAPPPPPPSRPPPLSAEASPWTQSRCVLPCCNPAVQRRWAGDVVQGSGPGCSTATCEGVCNGPGCQPPPSGQGAQSNLQSPLPPAPLPLQTAVRRALLFPPIHSPMMAMAMEASATNVGVPGVHGETLASGVVPHPPPESHPLLPQLRPDLHHPRLLPLQQPGSRPASISAPEQPFVTDFSTHPFPHLHHQYQHHQHQQRQHQYGGLRKTYTASSLPCSRNGAVSSNINDSGDGGGGCGGCGSGGGGNGGGGEHYVPLPLPSDTAASAAGAGLDRILSPSSSSYISPQKPPLPHLEVSQAGAGHWGPEALAMRQLEAGPAAAAGGLVEGVSCIASRLTQVSPAIVGGKRAAPVALQSQPAAQPSMPVAVYNGGGSQPCRINWQLAQTQQHQELLPLPGYVARHQHQHQPPESPNVQPHIALLPNSQDWHQQHRHPLWHQHQQQLQQQH